LVVNGVDIEGRDYNFQHGSNKKASMSTINTSQNGSSGISQELSEKIARHFNLLLNQATIYGISHPSIAAMVPAFYRSLKEGLAKAPILSIMLERDSLYLEDWCIDKRVNLRRIVNHFKKAGIQSISFSEGMMEEELLPFLAVFCDPKAHPTAEEMKAGLKRHRVVSIRLNYVFYKYKKMITDEEGSADDEATLGGDHAAKKQLTAEAALAELERSLSLQTLLEDPTGFSRELLETGGADGPDEEGLRPGLLVAEKLRQLGNEIRSAPLGTGSATLESMIQAVFKMRSELLETIETQKAMGVIYREESLIQDEAQALTRQVIIRLIREEYNRGEISIPRLAQILRRMLPDVKEMRRILPELKEALLADGMPLSDFLTLIKELTWELQDEGLVKVLQEAAEEVGVTAEELILHIKEDPKSAAELIILAAEIRNAGLTGDERQLTDMLVDYVERVGNHLAIESAKAEGIEGGKHLNQILSRIQMELVEQLGTHPLKTEVISSVDQRLSERISSTLRRLKSSWVFQQLSGEGKLVDAAEIVRVLENTLESDRELEEILDPIRTTLQSQGMSESAFEQIYNDVFSRLKTQQERRQWGDLPSNTFNRSMTFFLLNWLIQKAMRYPGTFSAILISVREISLHRAIARDVDLNSSEIRNTVLETLQNAIRGVDILGTLGENRIILILPMTPIHGAHIVLDKISRILKLQRYTLQGIPARAEFCLTAIPFSRSRTPTVESFIDAAEKSLLRVIAARSKTR